MCFRFSLLFFVFVGLLSTTSDSAAQMFGSRTTGGSISRRELPGTTQLGEVGVLQGNERFIRGNRRPGSFVGNDPRNRQGFVGAQGEVRGRVQSAQAGLRIENGAEAARAAAGTGRTTQAMYEPRLSVDFAYQPRAKQTVSSELTERLQSCEALHRLGPIAVLLEGRTATLRGTVASAADRALAQQLVLFEPGISAVRNELTLPAPSSPVRRPAAAKVPAGPREF